MSAERLEQERVATLESIQKSTEYVLEVLDFFHDSFEAFRHRAPWAYPEINFSGFIMDDDSGWPLEPKAIKEVPKESRDGSASP